MDDLIPLAGQLCFGLCADPHLVDELHLIADAIEAEAQALLGAAGLAEQARAR
jgi:hypothetical protein